MQLTPPTEIEIFKRLAYKSALEVGMEFHLDEHYKDKRSIRNAVVAIYRKIKENPVKYGIEEQTLSLIKDAMAHRNLAKDRQGISQAEAQIDSSDIKSLVVGVRDKAFRLMDKKLTQASKSKKAFAMLSLRDLNAIAGTMFDKGQIIQGQATENIAVMAKIEGNLNPQDAIDLVLKMREANVAQHKKKSVS